MSTIMDMPLIMIFAFVFCVVSIVIIFKISKKMGPQYINTFANGTPFGKETKRTFQEKRIRNNPNNENVGPATDRCHFCGHKREQEKKTPFTQTLLEKDRKTCKECHLFVEYF